MKPIPIAAAHAIADRYGYDQVIVYARKVGVDPDPHGEHMTTYGRGSDHCAVAARIGAFLQTKIMGWTPDDTRPVTDEMRRLLATAREALAGDKPGKAERALDSLQEMFDR